MMLRTLLVEEPQHIEFLVQKKDLLGILQYCVFKIGQKEMITPHLLGHVTKVMSSVQPDDQIRSNTENNKFRLNFLKNYFDQILLNPHFLKLKCTRENEQRDFRVLNELVIFYYRMCCLDFAKKDNRFDFGLLREFIVTRSTVKSLGMIIETAEF